MVEWSRLGCSSNFEIRLDVNGFFWAKSFTSFCEREKSTASEADSKAEHISKKTRTTNPNTKEESTADDKAKLGSGSKFKKIN